MSIEFTTEGLSIQTLDEAFEQLAEGFRGIYGQDINLDPDAPDGQRVGLTAKLSADAQAAILQLYDSMDPDLATGDRLFTTLKFAGVNPRPATRSQWDIEVTTDRALTLEQDYTIEDEVGQLWFVPDDLALPQGTTTVTFRAVNFGSVEGLSGAELSQSTVVLGVTALVATVDAAVGVEEETEQQIRERRNRSLQLPSYSTVGGMFARLANTAGVTDLQVYENDTKDYDVTLNLDANTEWVVIEGGTQADIIETIAKNKTGGTPLKGTQVGIYNETRTLPDGTEFIVPHRMRFDRPNYTALYVKITATRKDSEEPVDVELIKQELTAFVYRIGQDAEAAKLYDIAYRAGENFVLSNLTISIDNSTFTDGRLNAAADGKFTIDTTNVNVVEVTP